MGDTLHRGLTVGGGVRFAAVVVTDVAREAARRHKTLNGATYVLAETLAATALLIPSLQEGQKLSLQMTGDGPLHSVTVDVDLAGHLRGFVDNPRVLIAEDTGTLLGEGLIRVMRSTVEQLISEGTVPIEINPVATNLSHYLSTSEQVHSACALRVTLSGVDVTFAGGLLVQALPGEDLAEFETLAAAVTGGAVSLEEAGIEAGALETTELSFQCQCSREKVASMLNMLDDDELRAMRDEDEGAEVTCRFCNEVYEIDAQELSVLLGNVGEVN